MKSQSANISGKGGVRNLVSRQDGLFVSLSCCVFNNLQLLLITM